MLVGYASMFSQDASQRASETHTVQGFENEQWTASHGTRSRADLIKPFQSVQKDLLGKIGKDRSTEE
jgi:hypothetical protein